MLLLSQNDLNVKINKKILGVLVTWWLFFGCGLLGFGERNHNGTSGTGVVFGANRASH
jgi:hypothetical protein